MADPVRTQRSGESLLWAFDVAAQLPAAATLVSTPLASSLVNTRTGVAFPTGLSGSPSVSGSTVRQRVIGLVAGETYRLVWTWTDSAGNTQQSGLTLEVPW